jgi:hypothetical protein
MEFVFKSSLTPSYRSALEELVFFNPLQARTESAIVPVLDSYGLPTMVSDTAGLRLSMTGRDDVQCLFALIPWSTKPDLAGMAIYIRPAVEEIVVLHIGVARRYGRDLRSSLPVVIGLFRAIRGVARRLRGVRRLRILYLKDRQFQIAVAPRRLTALSEPIVGDDRKFARETDRAATARQRD